MVLSIDCRKSRVSAGEKKDLILAILAVYLLKGTQNTHTSVLYALLYNAARSHELWYLHGQYLYLEALDQKIYHERLEDCTDNKVWHNVIICMSIS